MSRKKVKLAYISNNSARKAAFKKRKNGLMKKISELSTLCGIDACAIIYSTYDSQPEVWPSPLGVQSILAKFKKRPEMEKSKMMVNRESFLKQRIAKANELLKKQRKKNREKEMMQSMLQILNENVLQNLSMVDLNYLKWQTDQNLKEIHERAETLKKEAHIQVTSANKMAGADHIMLRNGGENVHVMESEPPAHVMNAIPSRSSNTGSLTS